MTDEEQKEWGEKIESVQEMYANFGDTIISVTIRLPLLLAADTEIKRLRSQLCAAKEATEKHVADGARELVLTALSSTAPCPHAAIAERVKNVKGMAKRLLEQPFSFAEELTLSTVTLKKEKAMYDARAISAYLLKGRK